MSNQKIDPVAELVLLETLITSLELTIQETGFDESLFALLVQTKTERDVLKDVNGL